MNLLIITDDEEDDDLEEELSPFFDDVDTASIANVRIDAGDASEVRIAGQPLDGYDALYLQPRIQTAIFSRVFLEVLLERDINTNINAAAFFILAKKNYLFQVLAEKDVPTPTTAVVSTEKGVSGIENDMDFPLVGKKYEGFVRRDMNLLDDSDELSSFVEHMEHGKHVLLLQEYVDGDVFDCLYVDGDIVSINLESDSWRKEAGKATASYHTISSDLADVVEHTAESIGANICRVRLVDGKVVDAYLDPALSRFKKISGKNMYEKVADALKE